MNRGCLYSLLAASMKRVLTDCSQIELVDQSNTAWFLRGSDLASLGNYAEALESFDRAIALQPNDTAAWVFRAVMLIHLEQYPAALESCNRAIAISPDYAEAWTFRGVALHRLGHYQDAYASYDRAVGQEYLTPRARLKQWIKQRFEALRQAFI
jgi:tetratricopeptide (TPR) repeat protein